MIGSLFRNRNFKFQRTFTYYVPAPPERKTGYQEKEFDLISDYLLKEGFEIIDIKIQAHSHERSSGMWILCLLGTNDKRLADEKIRIDISDVSGVKSSQEHPMDPDIIHEI